jgi:hypothetical protein
MLSPSSSGSFLRQRRPDVAAGRKNMFVPERVMIPEAPRQCLASRAVIVQTLDPRQLALS